MGLVVGLFGRGRTEGRLGLLGRTGVSGAGVRVGCTVGLAMGECVGGVLSCWPFSCFRGVGVVVPAVDRGCGVAGTMWSSMSSPWCLPHRFTPCLPANLSCSLPFMATSMTAAQVRAGYVPPKKVGLSGAWNGSRSSVPPSPATNITAVEICLV